MTSLFLRLAATFGWLCVETLTGSCFRDKRIRQPPSGGCVLKHRVGLYKANSFVAATFGWLCVETIRR